MGTCREGAALILVLLVGICVVSCGTYAPIPNEDRPRIEQGDHLRVTTRLGALHEFVVERVDNETIWGPGTELALADIAFVERKAGMSSAGKALLFGTLAIGAYAAVLALFLSSLTL